MRDLHQTPFKSRQMAATPQYRFSPVVDLSDGSSLGSLCDMSVAFEERASFGPVTAPQNAACPATWLSDRLVEIACAVHSGDPRDRPIIVPAPVSALRNVNAAIACDAAIRRTVLCQQEICLEFPDSAFTADGSDTTLLPTNFRRRGFRVSVDMRKSWQSILSEPLRLLIDTIRVEAAMLETEPELIERCEAASAAGIVVIAENAKWRDGQELATFGVRGAVSPKADA